MPACIFLFPNLILTHEQTQKLGGQVVPDSLKEFLAQSDKLRSTSIFTNPALYGYASEQWIWMLLSQRDTLAPFAPYLWKGLGGPRVSQELWSLNGFFLEKGKLLPSSDVFDIDEECDLRDLLSPLVRQYDFDIQVLDGRFFLVRKKPWQVACVPWKAQMGKLKTPADGPSRSQWEQLYLSIVKTLAASHFNSDRSGTDKPRLDGFWISGGGFEEQLLPYTQIRCLISNDPVHRGIAEAAGISKNFLLRGGSNWPNCPDGDRLCVLDEIFSSEIKSDPAKWISTWESVVKRLQAYMDTAKGFEPYFPRLVATDGLRASVIEGRNEKKLFGLWKKNSDHCLSWLTCRQNQ